MKTVKLTIVFLLLLALPVFAVPSLVNYQGTLTDSSGLPVDGTVGITFALFDAESGGVEQWSEVQTVTVQNGSYHVLLGTTPFPTDLFQNDNLWLELTVEGETLLPRQQLSSVPYAMQAGQAQVAQGVADGAITSTQLDPSIVTLDQIAPSCPEGQGLFRTASGWECRPALNLAVGDVMTIPCYEGPGGTLDVGICRSGMREITSSGSGPCVDQVLPEPLDDTCDGVDNNCNGVVDDLSYDNDNDGFAACRDCNDDDPAIYPGVMESCDGIDNDCDGHVDLNCMDADWVWVGGSKIGNQKGVYGTQGVAVPGNIPGAREGVVSWRDESGHLWLFGGYGYDSEGVIYWLNDLWRFDGADWTWVSGSSTAYADADYGQLGVADEANVPGPRRYATTWVDMSGDLWLFGGFGKDAAGSKGRLNDLWRFDGIHWTWVSGSSVANREGVYGKFANPANAPGAREGAVSWIDDQGNLWLFGGEGYDVSGSFGPLNDLWKFDGVSWVWVKGSPSIDTVGIYGNRTMTEPANMPGARMNAHAWVDPSGGFWLLGGLGFDGEGNRGYLNDFWQFDGADWTWWGGSSTINDKGSFGVQNVAAEDNFPSARRSAASWADASGNFWLFGGWGFDTNEHLGFMNDLWRFDGSQWTWVSGSSVVPSYGNYGVQGVADAANIPGGRHLVAGWSDASGHFWLFGGFGRDDNNALIKLNDLWKYEVNSGDFDGDGVNDNLDCGTQDSSIFPGAPETCGDLIDSNCDGHDCPDADGDGYTSDVDCDDSDADEYPGQTWYTDADGDGFGSQTVTGSCERAVASDVLDNTDCDDTNPQLTPADADGDGLTSCDGDCNDSSAQVLPGLLESCDGLDNDCDGQVDFKCMDAAWAWMGGSSDVNDTGSYGTLGVADPANQPRSRNRAVTWVDQAGAFWLFGGQVGGDYLNDLWKYDGTDWTWVGGSQELNGSGVTAGKNIASPSAIPGARADAVTWSDHDGNLWLYGGHGIGVVYEYNGFTNLPVATEGVLSDLWKFDGTNWTLVFGDQKINQTANHGVMGVADPANTPGMRAGAVTWMDSAGQLWLFGGSGVFGYGSSAYFNDLWKFDGNDWTWVSGSSTLDAIGDYGTQGVAAPTNVPAARTDAVSWQDSDGNFWLFGGAIHTGTYPSVGSLNDLWKFDGANWTWVAGDSTWGGAGSYGTLGLIRSSNVPSPRADAVVWTDADDNLWLFGGSESYSLNDLWKFDGTNWVWVSGSAESEQDGVYGTLGVVDPANLPGSRLGAVSWVDTQGNLWMFGGRGVGNTLLSGDLNDLWKYELSIGDFDADGVNDYFDCEPANSSIHPNAAETCGDLVDSNCDGNDCADDDGDGYFSDLDCDDTEASAFPGNHETCDGIDNDCDGFVDLHCYDSAWVWVGGSSDLNDSGHFGPLGVADPANWPGARSSSVSWVDGTGQFWLLGGSGVYSSAWNDLWTYDGSNWTWVDGSSTSGDPGDYGTQGEVNPARHPASRHGAVAWQDSGENAWLFGGYGNSEYLNDLWQFDATNWIWQKGNLPGELTNSPGISRGTLGVADPSNDPGKRVGSFSWADAQDNLWLFGGYTRSPDIMVPTTTVNTSTASFSTPFYSGSFTVPTSTTTTYTTYSQSGSYNDLWKFDGQDWVWVGGSSERNSAGDYGGLGIAAAENTPGARHGGVMWIDASGNFWLFGGVGFDANAAHGYLNDLWKFDGTNWTWVSGSTQVNNAGIYGQLGNADAGNAPGARAASMSWVDDQGKLWLFGGEGQDRAGVFGQLNDLWMFDGTNWTWFGGSPAADDPGSYGLVGVADPANRPPARRSSATWKDAQGRLWLFGGSADGLLNDLWRHELAYGDYDSDGYDDLVDCNPTDPAINPGATEICNDGIDNNCDGQEGYLDGDGDGFTFCDGDCDDTDPTEYPGVTWYADSDGDGYGDSAVSSACERTQPTDVTDNTDCNDAEALENPGEDEVCDGLDNDCSGTVDDNLTAQLCAQQLGVCAGSASPACLGASGWQACGSSDYAAHAANYEDIESTCDGYDNDCDGTVDEGCPAIPIISEYVDNSNDDVLEITNLGYGDLLIDDCKIRIYENGANFFTTDISLQGPFLRHGESYVVCRSGLGVCNDTNNNLQWDGDDAIELFCDFTTQDVIGEIGFAPGIGYWGSNPTTQGVDLRRKCTVTSGDANGGDSFDPAVEWDGYNPGSTDDLGQHCP